MKMNYYYYIPIVIVVIIILVIAIILLLPPPTVQITNISGTTLASVTIFDSNGTASSMLDANNNSIALADGQSIVYQLSSRSASLFVAGTEIAGQSISCGTLYVPINGYKTLPVISYNGFAIMTTSNPLSALKTVTQSIPMVSPPVLSSITTFPTTLYIKNYSTSPVFLQVSTSEILPLDLLASYLVSMGIYNAVLPTIPVDGYLFLLGASINTQSIFGQLLYNNNGNLLSIAIGGPQVLGF